MVTKEPRILSVDTACLKHRIRSGSQDRLQFEHCQQEERIDKFFEDSTRKR